MVSAAGSGLIASLVGVLGFALAWVALQQANKRRDTSPPTPRTPRNEPRAPAAQAPATPAQPMPRPRPGPAQSPPGYAGPPTPWRSARVGCAAAVGAIALSVVGVAGLVLVKEFGKTPPPLPTGMPSPSPTTASSGGSPGPTATVTLTVLVTPDAAPAASTAKTDDSSGAGAAWIAAFGAVIAGLGTMASGGAALAALRRDTGHGGRRVHHRTEGQGRRPRR